MMEGFDVGLEMSGSESAFREMIANMSHGGKSRCWAFRRARCAWTGTKVIFNMLTIKGNLRPEIMRPGTR